MHRLSYGFVLGYHGCDLTVGERLLGGDSFTPSQNDYDWLGPGIYLWEANPLRGLDYAREAMSRKGSRITTPFVVGAVIDLGNCLDLTTAFGIGVVKRGYESLKRSHAELGTPMPTNTADRLRRRLDCAVIQRVHSIFEDAGLPAFDAVRGVFTEGRPAYEGAAFDEKTHVQIAVRNPDCIKGVFRVPHQHLAMPV
ncbi:hypothetical protein A33M_2802 [Rhodovulum sp. PH10]|uniref:hypothetical protein n=1 Tax=Rhodovulum sp. PH10 TaxID=1187851 RepID=UPI00027C28FB|nr:hypothetical protein [Rhodovulum sp. PH10]EJW11734.1 hypothetical protein A33M_2802 [Rhodovulum sp. PH10]